jgi:hypothetical protein
VHPAFSLHPTLSEVTTKPCTRKAFVRERVCVCAHTHQLACSSLCARACVCVFANVRVRRDAMRVSRRRVVRRHFTRHHHVAHCRTLRCCALRAGPRDSDPRVAERRLARPLLRAAVCPGECAALQHCQLAAWQRTSRNHSSGSGGHARTYHAVCDTPPLRCAAVLRKPAVRQPSAYVRACTHARTCARTRVRTLPRARTH